MIATAIATISPDSVRYTAIGIAAAIAFCVLARLIILGLPRQ